MHMTTHIHSQTRGGDNKQYIKYGLDMEEEDSEFVDTLNDEIRKRGAMAMDVLASEHAQDNMGYAYMGMNVNEGNLDNELNDLDGRGVTDSML